MNEGKSVDIAINKAQTLIEALPYIRQFYNKIVVVKYGGSAMLDEELKKNVIQDVALLKLVGICFGRCLICIFLKIYLQVIQKVFCSVEVLRASAYRIHRIGVSNSKCEDQYRNDTHKQKCYDNQYQRSSSVILLF